MKILKPCFVFLLFLLASWNSFATGALKAKVDERVELLSIVARLAGYPEYSSEVYSSYIADIHAHFDRFGDHPLIDFMRGMRQRNYVGYDAVAAMAVHIGDAPRFNPRVVFTDDIPESRWRKRNAGAFLRLLRRFYRDARCEEFFREQRQRYEMAERIFDDALEDIDTDWFAAYFGREAADRFHIVIGLGNGGSCYGPRVVFPDGVSDVYALMGVWKVDAAGEPVFPAVVKNILIHEFGHSFSNPEVDAFLTELESAGRKIFDHVGDIMKQQAYNNGGTVMRESMVRATVLRYLVAHGDTVGVHQQVLEEFGRGFLWVDHLSALLEIYERDRAQYPTMSDFMPRVVDFFNDEVVAYCENPPRIVSVDELSDGRVDPSHKTLTIRFDRPMKRDRFGFNLVENSLFPISSRSIVYSEDGKAVTVPVDLRPDAEYGFSMPSIGFVSSDGWPIAETPITFRTGE